MQVKRYALALFLLSIFALAQNPARGSNQVPDEAKKEEQFQIRRQHFDTGRQLLLLKGVSFNPDDLLREDWRTRLKPALDEMPEMHQSRYEAAPLSGAYFADTVYLPEKVQLSGHTLIVANYVVFEGKNPIIQGNFDVHFFPAGPVVVLETTLAQALHKKANFLNVKYGRKPVLPSFSLIQDLGHTGPHNITIDVNGPPPQSSRPVPQKSAPRMQNASWSGFLPSIFPFQASKPCTTGCDNSGDTGATGSEGASPGPAATGNPNGGSPAPNGSCATGSSANGQNGVQGGEGMPGENAGNGGVGGAGTNAGNINVSIALNDLNQYKFTAHGGTGGTGGAGGAGGAGGPGGNGGQGTAGGNGVTCGCTAGEGGNGGEGGAAGPGGKGGTGGNGGPGGNGGNISGTYPANGPTPSTDAGGGQGGNPGAAGASGPPGTPGLGGDAGIGAKDCSGNQARNGVFLGGGPVTSAGGPGNPGQSFGAAGSNGTVNLTAVQTTSGGGGGGGGDGGEPCLIRGNDPGSGGPPPTGCTGSPIIIDTEGEGFHLTSVVTGVSFDIAGTGQPVQMGWTDSHYHNAFLALPGADGLVHSGKELFGNFTPQLQSAHPNGFIALAQYDKPENGGNNDGIIDDHDQVFSQLRLWIDENHDGICQPNELHRLPELGVYSLALNYQESRRTDQFGNQFRYKAVVNPGERKDARDQTPTGDPGRWTYDVFFVVK